MHDKMLEKIKRSHKNYKRILWSGVYTDFFV